MIRSIVLLFMILAAAACDKSTSDLDPSLPECVVALLSDEAKSGDVKTIRLQAVNSQPHYWINTDAQHADGIEFILSSSCDTLCSYCGECAPAPCVCDYDDDDWEVIWKQ